MSSAPSLQRSLFTIFPSFPYRHDPSILTRSLRFSSSRSITFHKAVGWSIAFFCVVHALAHIRNFVLLGKATHTSAVKGFFFANFATGPVSLYPPFLLIWNSRRWASASVSWTLPMYGRRQCWRQGQHKGREKGGASPARCFSSSSACKPSSSFEAVNLPDPPTFIRLGSSLLLTPALSRTSAFLSPGHNRLAHARHTGCNDLVRPREASSCQL